MWNDFLKSNLLHSISFLFKTKRSWVRLPSQNNSDFRKMPTNHWTKLESSWIPKIQQNFQPQLRSYPRKQRPSQVSPLWIYFTIIFWANIWNNQKLTSEKFPKNIQEMQKNGHPKFPHLLYQLHVIQKQGSVFQLATRLTPRGGEERSHRSIPQVVPIWAVEIVETHEGIIPQTILFLPKKISQSQQNFIHWSSNLYIWWNY